jgi:hypothetical protein
MNNFNFAFVMFILYLAKAQRRKDAKNCLKLNTSNLH